MKPDNEQSFYEYMKDKYDFHENGGFGEEPTKGDLIGFTLTVSTLMVILFIIADIVCR